LVIEKSFKNKKVLITAGPTWVPLDKVRVISNTATGKTGMLLANSLTRQGAKVTLLLGPVAACYVNRKVKVIYFKFFDELNALLKAKLKKNKYAVIIQAAAVSDYQPSVIARRKLSSDKQTLNLTLKQTPKIIDSLRKAMPGAFIVGFKFEPDLSVSKLIHKARSLLKRTALDLVVANTQRNKHYAAYLVGKYGNSGPYLSKEAMVKQLLGTLPKCQVVLKK